MGKAPEHEKKPTVIGEVQIYRQPQHISYMALELRLSFHENPGDDELTHRHMDMKLWHGNTASIAAQPVKATKDN